ncbi:hypothetical protein [Mongoliibacter ruber]|uniref:Uncharacterized protein n=1 Tax=Mongoliibacter ruber TaxID=1750599 RepID=A0A2T0WPG2_9BACT|nr:hypothetical protein [Mongoliibacter ruber]PRY88601.1 hypothetical protein CLW00_104252 [Mongoliibacter ruber]
MEPELINRESLVAEQNGNTSIPSGEIQDAADASAEVVALEQLSNLANPQDASLDSDVNVADKGADASLDSEVNVADKDAEETQGPTDPLDAKQELKSPDNGDKFTPEAMSMSEALEKSASVGGTVSKGYEGIIGGSTLAHSIVQGSTDKLKSVIGFFDKARDAWKKKDWESGIQFFAEAGDTTHVVFTQIHKYGGSLPAGGASLLPGIGAGISIFKSAMNIELKGSKFDKLNEYNEILKLDQNDKDVLNKYIVRVEDSMLSDLVDFYLSIAELILTVTTLPPVGLVIGSLRSVKDVYLSSLEFWREFKGSKERQALFRVTGAKESMSEDEMGDLSSLRDKVADPETGKFNLKDGSLRDLLKIKLEIDTVNRQIQSVSGENKLKAKLNTLKNGLTDSLNNGIIEYNQTLSASEETSKFQISIDDVDKIAQIHSNVIAQVLKKANTEKTLIGRVKNIFHKEKKDKILKEIFNGELPTDIPIEDLSKGENADYFWEKTQKALNMALEGRKYYSNAELKKEVEKILNKYNISKNEIDSIMI